MKNELRNYWLPLTLFTGAGVVLTILASITPAKARDNGTWTQPYTGSFSTTGNVFSVTNSGTGIAINALAGSAEAILAQTTSGDAIEAGSTSGNGLYGASGSSAGVSGYSTSAQGVYGYTAHSGQPGVLGYTTTAGYGVYGQCDSSTGYGGYFDATSGSGGTGLYGTGATNGVSGVNSTGNGNGIIGTGSGSSGSAGVDGYNSSGGYGVYGETGSGGYGVYGSGEYGVYGNSSSGEGVYGYSSYSAGTGVYAKSTQNIGLYAITDGSNTNSYGLDATGGGLYCAYFYGDVNIDGTLYKNSDDFKIDHPADPANKYLVHACVESNEMMNIYRGNVVLNSDGKALVDMPSWFEAENTDVNYQLTCIGKAATVYVSQEMSNNHFEISGEPGVKVCWVVTGARQDGWAKAHPLVVEQNKPASERGKYRNPVEIGKPITLGVNYSAQSHIQQRSTGARGVSTASRTNPPNESASIIRSRAPQFNAPIRPKLPTTVGRGQVTDLAK